MPLEEHSELDREVIIGRGRLEQSRLLAVGSNLTDMYEGVIMMTHGPFTGHIKLSVLVTIE
jgi:hypothetical protein